MFFDQAEQVLREGLSFAKEDDKHLFNMHALLGSLYENKGDIQRAVTEYEAAKKSCDSNKCNDHKEAYFNLGSAYAELNPPEEERGHPAAAVVLEDHLQGRARGEVRRPVRAVAGDRAPHGRIAPVAADARSAGRPCDRSSRRT